MKIPYYPGCTLSTVAKDFDDSARDSASLLGIELEELDKWNCCGASYPLAKDNLMGLSAPRSVLVNAQKKGDSVATLCSVCYNVLKRTSTTIGEDSETRSILNTFAEEDYDGTVEVLHFLEILRDKIGFDKLKNAVTRPLKGIKAAAYYGCMLLRPFEGRGIDDAEAPTIFENLLSSIGCTPVEFPDKVECCGAHLAMDRADVVKRLSGNILSSATGSGADIIVTSCPLCQHNLEQNQDALRVDMSGYIPVPIVYFTQVLGLALGQPEKKLGFEKYRYNPMPFFREMGV